MRFVAYLSIEVYYRMTIKEGIIKVMRTHLLYAALF